MATRRGRPAGGSNAAERLVDACWELLVAGESPTVAAVCRRAGCAPPTLYHHYTDLPGLHRAASARAFDRWAARLESEIPAQASARERLARRGAAYVAWGIGNPAAYRVLFIDPAPDPGDGEAGPGAGLAELMADLAEITGYAGDDPRLLVEGLAHWGAVHGLTCLALAHPTLPRELITQALNRLTAALGHSPQ